MPEEQTSAADVPAPPLPPAATSPRDSLGSEGNPLKVSIVSFHGYAPALLANGRSLKTRPGSVEPVFASSRRGCEPLRRPGRETRFANDQLRASKYRYDRVESRSVFRRLGVSFGAIREYAMVPYAG